MSAPYRLGEDAKLYYAATPVTTATVTVPSTIAANVKNVKVGAQNDQPEYTTRASGGVKQYANSLADYPVSFEILCPGSGVTDAAYQAIRSAYTTKGEIALYALTGVKTDTGVEGPAGNFTIGKFEIQQGPGDVLFAAVEAKPSSYNTWYVNGS